MRLLSVYCTSIDPIFYFSLPTTFNGIYLWLIYSAQIFHVFLFLPRLYISFAWSWGKSKFLMFPLHSPESRISRIKGNMFGIFNGVTSRTHISSIHSSRGRSLKVIVIVCFIQVLFFSCKCFTNSLHFESTITIIPLVICPLAFTHSNSSCSFLFIYL